MVRTYSTIRDLCSASGRYFVLLRSLSIVILGILAYRNTFRMTFNFDDTANILSNPVIREFNLGGFRQLLHSRRAVGLLTFQINHYFSGADVFYYHLVNLIIHIISALLVYALLSQLMKTPYWVSTPLASPPVVPVAFLSALLFVAHPVQTQAVTYVVQRFTSLATLFYLATTVCYVKGRLLQQREGGSLSAGSVCWYVAMSVVFVLALFTKEIAYTLPIALLLTELLFFPHSQQRRTTVAAIVVLLVLFLGGWVAATPRTLHDILTGLDETTRVQTAISRGDYLCTQFRVITTYLRLLLFPVNQSVDYDYRIFHSFFDWQVVGSFLLLTALLATAILLIIRSRQKQPLLRLAAFGILWFFLTLAVESSLIPIIDVIFEHRVYLPSVGFFAAATASTFAWTTRRNSPRTEAVVSLGVMGICIILAVITFKRNVAWTNEVTLWQDTVTKRPLNARAWNNLGYAYLRKQQAKEALPALVRSIELDPSKADAKNNLSMALDLLGRYKDRFHRTQELFQNPQAMRDPVVSKWLGDTYNNLGLAYEIMGNYPKAIINYQNAIAFHPALGEAYFNLGLVSFLTGERDRALQQEQILRFIAPALADRLHARMEQQ